MPGTNAGPRVAIVSLYLDPLGRGPDALLNGAWRDFGRVAAAARRAGARVTMVQAAWEDAERTIEGVPCLFIREPGPPFIRLPGGRRVRRRTRRLFERIAALHPEVIHFEGLILPRQLRALARALPHVPIVAQDHATKCPRGWRRWWYRWGFAPLAGVVFTARAQAAPFLATSVLRRELPVFEVIEVSTAFTPGDQTAARVATGLAGDPCLLWVGHLDRNKDPLTVLDAVARTAAALPDLRLYLCYQDAPLLPAVEARIGGDAALADRVRLLGRVPHADIQVYYRAADFLVQASHAEGSGYAVIEALACGTTPLVTDIPSFRRMTANGTVGGLAPVGDAARLAEVIRDWAGRPDRTALRAAARRHFERELSFDAIGRQLRAVYDQVLART